MAEIPDACPSYTYSKSSCTVWSTKWMKERKKERKRPCEFFDLIAGVDSSSPIAVFLGLFRMTIEDAQAAFYRVHTAVFADDSYSPETRAQKLEAEIKKIMDSQNISHTIKISDASFTTGCKVALCYSPANRIDTCNAFRNYQTPLQSSKEVTVVEAICASWASPGLISPVSIGSVGSEELVVSAINGFSNPIHEVIKEAYNVFGPDARVSCLLNVGSGYRGIVSLDDQNATAQAIGARVMMNCESVAEEVYRRFARLGVYYRLSVDHGLEGWGRFEAGFGTMKSHVDAYFSKKEQSAKLDRCISASLKDGDTSMDELYGPKTRTYRSAHGLPPLSAYFVMRKKPMDAMIKVLIDGSRYKRQIMVISGLGGSGKTQLALKFARDFRDSYQHILFIDASSSESIRKGLVSRVQPMCQSVTPKTVEEAMEFLTSPDEHITKDWFIIFDNADNSEVSLATYIPSCDHGTVLITTRDPSLGELAPDAHMKLGNMDEDEAVEVLLSTAFPARDLSLDMTQSQVEEQASVPVARDREAACDIARELGYLPIAVVQAGCYIKPHRVLHEYLERLKSNRSEMLKRTTRVHLDRLRYPHGVYASFDIVVQALSQRAVNLLGVLSFFHWANLPRLLFTIAAKSKFAHEEINLLDRPPEFKDTIHFLTDILCPKGEWKEDELDLLLEELQKYSLVTLVATGATISLRFHPLVHGWARDRMTTDEQDKHQAAAIRLLTSGITEGDDHGLYEHLSSHALYICPTLDVLHVNDRATISRIVQYDKKYAMLLEIWKKIHQEFKEVHGAGHSLRMSRANRELGSATWLSGDRKASEEIHRKNMIENEKIFGRDSPETISARALVARAMRWTGRHVAAEEIEKENLRVQLRTLGLKSLVTARGMQDLADTLSYLGRLRDRKALMLGVLEIHTKVLGRSAQRTIFSLENLARNASYQEVEKLRKEVLELRRKLHGQLSLQAVVSMVWLASRYHQQGRYEEEKRLRASEVETRRVLQGEDHENTLEALFSLASAHFQLRQYVDAERLYKELLSARQGKHGKLHAQTLLATYWVGRTAFEQSKYDEAETLWVQWLDGCRTFHGKRHSETLSALHWLGRLYSMQQNYSEAAQLWAERLETGGPNRMIVGWLSNVKFELGQYYEAEKLRKEELESIKRVYGPRSPTTLASMEALAKIYSKQRRYVEAEGIRKEVLEGQTRWQGPLHANTLKAKFMLGMTYHDQGRNGEAEQLWKELLEQMRKVHGKTHGETVLLLSWLSKVYPLQENYTDAENVQKEYLETCRSKHGNNHLDTLWAMHQLGCTWHKLGRRQDAERLWKEELLIRRAIKDQAFTASVSEELAQLYFSAGKLEEAKNAIEESIRIRRRTLMPSAPKLVKSIQLLDSIVASIQREASTPMEENGEITLWTNEELVGVEIPDPGGDPTCTPPQTVPEITPITTYQHPFALRPLFGTYPNFWSMF